MSTILVTGGAGYIGSHTTVELLNTDNKIIILDNLTNSSEASLAAVNRLTNRNVEFVKGDIRNEDLLAQLFQEKQLSLIHI